MVTVAEVVDPEVDGLAQGGVAIAGHDGGGEGVVLGVGGRVDHRGALALRVGDGTEHHHQGDGGDGEAPVVVAQVDDGRQHQQRHQVHHLDQRVEGRAGGVLERVADGVADDGGLVGLGALAAHVAVLDVLLGVVPGAAGVGQEVGHELAGEDGARPGSRPGRSSRCRSRRSTGVSTASSAGVASSRSDGGGADVDDRAVVGPLGVVHDPGLLAELAADLLHDDAGGAAHGPDGERGEQEGDRATDEQADEGLGVGDVDLDQRRTGRR